MSTSKSVFLISTKNGDLIIRKSRIIIFTENGTIKFPTDTTVNILIVGVSKTVNSSQSSSSSKQSTAPI